MSDARDDILQSVRGSRPRPPAASAFAPPRADDLAATFMAKVSASHAELHRIPERAGIPGAVLALLTAVGAAPRLHIPQESPMWTLPWHRVPQLERTHAAPSSEDAALSAADYGIAETGTLAFFSGRARPAAWHFLPGRELVLISRAQIVGTLEDLFFLVRPLPSTLNLVTGPSRTADIEQTIELGAHGPREVHVLLLPE